MSDSEDYGPSLPPGFQPLACQQPDCNKAATSQSFCPPAMSSAKFQSAFIGPVIPSPMAEQKESRVIGPLPGEGGTEMSVIEAIELRAQRMREKLEKPDIPDVQEREAWMTELPPELSGVVGGLTARTFKRRDEGDRDRSGWTDTPADKLRKEKEGTTAEMSASSKVYENSTKDKRSSEEIKEHNKAKRPKSLLEMHEKKLKKKKKKEKKKSKKGEKNDKDGRRPFDREVDLKVNRFDEAQKRSVIKKSQLLNSRFGHGSGKFL